MNDADDANDIPDAHYVVHLLEQMRDMLCGVNEGVTAIRQELERVPKRDDFDELKRLV